MLQFTRISVIDSHTGGEPTRTVVGGGPELGNGSMAERAAILKEKFDHFRSAVINEPRGSDVIVGALLCEPVDTAHTAGVIFFNNVGVLGMCGHGTIGLGVTLAHMGKIQPGKHTLETPVGIVGFELHDDHRVSVENVPSYRWKSKVSVDVAGVGTVNGDIAWGGNWFFLIEDHGQTLHISNVEALTDYTWRVRQALAKYGITGIDGAEIDHIELFAPVVGTLRVPSQQNGTRSVPTTSNSRNFVLCPGKAYDRSPCGTGTSAKLACLAADGKLQPGEIWRQESIIGSVFEASYRVHGDAIIPTITGSAYISAESILLFDPLDPFREGIRS